MQDLIACYAEGAKTMQAEDPLSPLVVVSKFDPGLHRPSIRYSLTSPSLKISRTYCLSSTLNSYERLGVRIENFVFADLSTSTQVHPCHLEETKATENVPWRRGYYDQPRSWESDGPGPGDVTDITRKFMAQKARLPPVDVAPRRTIEEKMSDKARQLSQHAAKKRRQLQHLKHAEESSSSSTSSASSDSDDDE